MLLVPRILLHSLVVFYTLEYHLAKAVKAGDVTHLRVEELCHQGARGRLIMNLIFRGSVKKTIYRRQLIEVERLTWVHLLTPYLTMSPLVRGAETSTIWLR